MVDLLVFLLVALLEFQAMTVEALLVVHQVEAVVVVVFVVALTVVEHWHVESEQFAMLLA